VLRDSEEVADFGFVVAEDGRAQLDVDVAKVAGAGRTGCGCCIDPDADPHLRAGGMLLVHVGSGRGAYAVVVTAGEGDAQHVVFDSRRLEKGDIFTATVLRPGRYAVTNTLNGARAELEVRYPERRREPLRAAEPVQVRVGDRFDPEQPLSRQRPVHDMHRDGAAAISSASASGARARHQCPGLRRRCHRSLAIRA
jgi:hypothetical protein